MAAKSKYYAYRLPSGREGIADSWPAAEKLVKGTADARYRGFKTRDEAEAWLLGGALYEIKPRPKLVRGIYFDAGTGRGNGVEISVTDEVGRDLLHRVLPKAKINKHGKHKVPGEVTNNYGELLGCKYALELAMKTSVKKIFGDSKIVIAYWSRGFLNEKHLPKKTITLIGEVEKLRNKFESRGGSVGRVSGDHNPADLGFH